MRKVFMKSDQFWPDCDRKACRSKDLWTEHVLLQLCVSPHFCTKFMLEMCYFGFVLPLFFILATLGDPWRPLAIGHWLENGQLPPKGLPRVAKVEGGPQDWLR